MKNFDYEKAKAGAPVCTLEGRKVRIVCFDVKNNVFPILALAENPNGTDEDIMSYTRDGKYYNQNLGFEQSVDDLKMATVKHEGWVLICPVGPQCIAHIYDTREEAEEDAEREMITYSAIAHIEWEE